MTLKAVVQLLWQLS